jgi:hypothetical protein
MFAGEISVPKKISHSSNWRVDTHVFLAAWLDVFLHQFIIFLAVLVDSSLRAYGEWDCSIWHYSVNVFFQIFPRGFPKFQPPSEKP